MKRSGFTLIEVLVVIAIIGVLATVGFMIGKSALAKSRQATCLGNLRSLGVALESYLQEHNRILPKLEAGRSSKTEDIPVLETVLLPYVQNAETFKCSQDSKQYKKSGSSYLWNSTQSGIPISQMSFFGIKDRPDKIPLILDKEAWHSGTTNFLYADQTSSNKVRFTTGN